MGQLVSLIETLEPGQRFSFVLFQVFQVQLAGSLVCRGSGELDHNLRVSKLLLEYVLRPIEVIVRGDNQQLAGTIFEGDEFRKRSIFQGI